MEFITRSPSLSQVVLSELEMHRAIIAILGDRRPVKTISIPIQPRDLCFYP